MAQSVSEQTQRVLLVSPTQNRLRASDEGEAKLQLLVCEIDVQPGFKLHPNVSA